MIHNPLGIRGLAFIELAGPDTHGLAELLSAFGFSYTHQSKDGKFDYYTQGDIHFFLHRGKDNFGTEFSKIHGPSIPAMGCFVDDVDKAYETALKRGAQAAESSDWEDINGSKIPAIKGIGDSNIYLVRKQSFSEVLHEFGMIPLASPQLRADLGFQNIDHLTNNVPQGSLLETSRFYKEVFGFTEVRYFNIRGDKTGLVSYALRSPCGSFCIPINEGTEDKSQINEYLKEYRGPGIQHLAFLTKDIIKSVEGMRDHRIATLDIDAEYYKEVFKRVPGVKEDHRRLQDLNILIDGDQDGYLLQIFTKNLIGPIFIEIIQRKNHQSFGEGNFQALFRSMERDQERRGVL